MPESSRTIVLPGAGSRRLSSALRFVLLGISAPSWERLRAAESHSVRLRLEWHWWSGAHCLLSRPVSPSSFRTVQAVFPHTAHRWSSAHGYAAAG